MKNSTIELNNNFRIKDENGFNYFETLAEAKSLLKQKLNYMTAFSFDKKRFTVEIFDDSKNDYVPYDIILSYQLI